MVVIVEEVRFGGTTRLAPVLAMSEFPAPGPSSSTPSHVSEPAHRAHRTALSTIYPALSIQAHMI